MEPALMVIGLNHLTAPLAMRERFCIADNRSYEVLHKLHSAEGIDEVMVVSTCCRTEFWLWAAEPTLAANSLLQFLGSAHALKLTEWEHFYRLLDDSALSHIFRVTSGVDSLVLGNLYITARVRAAWEQAQAVGTAGPFLNQVTERALAVCQRVHEETGFREVEECMSSLALELGAQLFGSLEGRRILLVGAEMNGHLSARGLKDRGVKSVVVIDQVPARAKELAAKFGGTSALLEDRWNAMLRADIVISHTGCPHVILTREEAERIALERNRVPLMVVDLGVPRDVDPEVRKVDGMVLYNMDALERMETKTSAERKAAVTDSEKIIAAEVQIFRGRLRAERTLPTVVALRNRLEELCRQELDSFITERGPFTREQNQSLHAITTQLIQTIASSLVRELKEFPEKAEQERMTAAVTRLFHLDSLKTDTPQTAPAGTRSRKSKTEKAQERAIAM
ncbi:MAG TPA: glutamyl-tRNA reductase [Verrucomicrobiae bacterium]|nr:glutamyl-tRNA reductase [Verrucomicrobiae bacterium]